MISPADLGLDPEVEGILVDIARDKNSTLLRVPTRDLGAFAVSGHVAGTTGLTSAERHLLQTHRVELARALRDICRSSLRSNPVATLHLAEQVSLSASSPQLSPARAVAIARERIADLDEGQTQEVTSINRLLETATTTHDSEFTTIERLAAASIRLQPTDTARILVGIERTYRGLTRSSIAILSGVVAGSSTHTVKSYALSNLANALNESGQTEDALTAYLAAGELSDDRAIPALSSLLLAASLDDTRRGRRIASRVDWKFGPNHPAIDRFLRMVRNQLDHHKTRLSNRSRKCLDRIARTGSPTTLRIVHELRHL